MNRKLWIDGAEMSIIATTRNGEMKAVCWGQTSATAHPLPKGDRRMIKIEDFENAPVGTTATRADGNRAMKIYYLAERRWVTPIGTYLDDEEMMLLGFVLDPSAATAAREALDLAWVLAHEVEPGQVVPKGTRYLEFSDDVIGEYIARTNFEVSPESPVLRTVEPLPEQEPDWLDAPAVIATAGWGPDRGVWVPKSGGRWKCSCCRDESHWTDLHDVVPLYPKETSDE